MYMKMFGWQYEVAFFEFQRSPEEHPPVSAATPCVVDTVAQYAYVDQLGNCVSVGDMQEWLCELVCTV